MNGRRMIGILLASAITLLPAAATAGSAQTVRGTVLTPTGAAPACQVLAYPAAILQTSVRAGWVIAYGFDVSPVTWGHGFTVKAARGLSDLDITFYGSATKTFAKRGFKPESGIVPAGATDAYVCLAVGAPASFTYWAG